MYLFAAHGYTEEDHTAKALLYERPEEFLELVHAPPGLAGKGGNVDVRIGIVGNKDGVHEHRLCDAALRLP